MIAVISGSQSEFEDFIRRWVFDRDQEIFKRVSRVDDVRGVNFTEVIRIGSFYRMKDHQKLHEYALSRIKD